MSEIAKTVGQRIRNYRTRQGLSQEKLAEMSGCHPTYIGQVERGEKNATLESIEKIAAALNVSLSKLFEKLGGQDDGARDKGGQVMGSFEMFRKMIVDNTSYHLEDVERIRISRPEEYALFTSQDVKSFLSVPYSRREHGIIFLRNPKRYGDKPDMLRIVANILTLIGFCNTDNASSEINIPFG